jgi:type VI protein secretion system component VasF
VACTAIAGMTAVRTQDRFGGTNGVDRLAQAIARQTGDAEDVVRDALLKTLKGQVRVDTGASVWIAAAGGLLIAVGGALGLAWVRERERERRHAVVPPAPDAV